MENGKKNAHPFLYDTLNNIINIISYFSLTSIIKKWGQKEEISGRKHGKEQKDHIISIY